jgi:hypothetical protein
MKFMKELSDSVFDVLEREYDRHPRLVKSALVGLWFAFPIVCALVVSARAIARRSED